MRVRVPPGAIPVSLITLAAALVWLGLFVAGPWFLRNPPGPSNPSFAWYMIYNLFPLVLFAAVGTLFVGAWKAWRSGR